MIFDDKSMGFERFFVTKTPQNRSWFKRTHVGIIYNISGKEKNTKMFNSKIRLRSEHKVYCKLDIFFRSIIPLVRIGLYRVSYSERSNAEFEKTHAFSIQIMLTS